MTQSAKRIPEWLTTNLLVIVVTLAIIGLFIAIDRAAQSAPELRRSGHSETPNVTTRNMIVW